MGIVKRNLDIYRTRLVTLGNILGRAEAELFPDDPEKKALLTARLADDMLPLPNQVSLPSSSVIVLRSTVSGLPL